MTIAFNYDIGKLLSDQGQVYGMEVAILDWFRAYFQYGTQEKIPLLIDESARLEALMKVASEVGIVQSRLVPIDRRFTQENLSPFDMVFRPDPFAKRLFWQRQSLKGAGFAFCGLAHAISGIESGDILEQYCLAPTYASDAIVCPSRAVQSAIRTFWDLYADYLKVHFGTSYRCDVDLPIIPLGINTSKFEALTMPGKRADQRQKLGLADDEFTLLWVGRMSHAIKGHPIAMFQAAERAAELSGKKIHLVMYGYFVPENAEGQFAKLASTICKKAKVTFISNKDARFPEGVWAAGDAFLSLIDNMQESFGLTPIEAMAAGLPRIISDWNGYRDSVTHGEDGFLVPTVQPPAGQGSSLAEQLLSGKEMYGGFLGKTALSVAVDADAAAQSIVVLANNPDLRRTVVQKAKQRAARTYAWQNIIPAYENLWRTQVEKRRAAQHGMVRKHYPSALPQNPDPYTMYAAYPSSTLKESDKLKIVTTSETVRILWEHEINTYGLDMMVPPDQIPSIINNVTKQPGITIAVLFQAFPTLDKPALWRTLGWLMKLGIVSRVA